MKVRAFPLYMSLLKTYASACIPSKWSSICCQVSSCPWLAGVPGFTGPLPVQSQLDRVWAAAKALGGTEGSPDATSSDPSTPKSVRCSLKNMIPNTYEYKTCTAAMAQVEVMKVDLTGLP